MSLPSFLGNHVADIPQCASLYQDMLEGYPNLVSDILDYVQGIKNFSRIASFYLNDGENPFLSEYKRFRKSSTLY